MYQDYLNNIVTYYRDSEISYSQGWDLKHSLAIHAGYFDKGNTNFRKALKRLNEVVAEHAQITKDDYVLDAGCGVGGSSIFLAQNYDCKVLGITISEYQVESAKKNALNYGVENLVNFQKADYTQTGLKSETFDVILGFESVCCSIDKKDFIKEAYRLLKPNGRLVIVDYFQGREPSTEQENKDYAFFLDAFACDNFDKPELFKLKFEIAGFKEVREIDSTINFMPNTLRLEILGTLSVWMNFILNLFNIKRTDARYKGGKGSILTSKFFKNGMLKYYIYSAKK